MPLNIFSPIFSITVTAISMIVGVSTFNLRNILGHDPTFLELSNFILVEQFSYYSMFYVHYRLFSIFLRCSFLDCDFFYVSITMYLILTVFFPKVINSVLKWRKFSIKFESHMLVCFPNLISSYYKNCNSITEFHYYRKIQLIHSLFMSFSAIILFKMREYIFPKFMNRCNRFLDIMLNVHCVVYTILAISSLIFIIEIVCIHFGISFLDFAFKKECKKGSESDLSEFQEIYTRHRDFRRKDSTHLCTLDIKNRRKYRRYSF